MVKKNRNPFDPAYGDELEGKYKWTQTENDVTLTVYLPSDKKYTGRDLKVEVHRTRLLVQIKGAETPLVSGSITGVCDADESWWQIENNNVEIWLIKDEKKKWWASVFPGEAEIDVSAIEGSLHLDHSLLWRLRNEHEAKLKEEEAAAAAAAAASASGGGGDSAAAAAAAAAAPTPADSQPVSSADPPKDE